MNFRKISIIAKWEFLERIKRRTFILSMIVMPIILIAISLLPSMLLNKTKDIPQPLGVVDFTGKYHLQFSNEIAKHKLEDGQPVLFCLNLFSGTGPKYSIMDFADSQILNNSILGYVIIKNSESPTITLRTNHFFDKNKLNIIEQAFNKVLIKSKAIENGLSEELSDKLLSNFTGINVSYINADTEEELFLSFINSYLFIFLLITMILFSGGMFVRSLVVEKSNRIIEIILSSCNANELLFGKVLGLSLLGLFQFFVWIIIGIVLYNTNTLDLTTINNLGYQIYFFTLGYIFYSAIFIGFGSVVSADYEAQQLTVILSIFLIIPILLAVEILNAPNSITALALSYFPLTSIPAMLLRLNITTPNFLEVISVSMILIFNLYLTIYISSKIFRFGLLKISKRPTLQEIINWIKTS